MEGSVTAAPARISIYPRRNAATDLQLARAVTWSRDWSAEFPHCLANHLPMVLVALQRMGASAERLQAYCHIYRDMNQLAPVPSPLGTITSANWRDTLGRREREGDYRRFFSSEVARLGATPAAQHYLPQLFPGFAASALHAFMRMAYATMTDSDEETGVALAYWAATYLSLGAATGSPPTTDDPLVVLGLMYVPQTFKQVEVERDLLWCFMQAVARKPEFASLVDQLAIGPQTRPRVAKVSLALLAATDDFCALHAVTGTHWLRLIEPRAQGDTAPLRYLWQAVAALVPKMGFPAIPAEDQLEHWRRTALPDWNEIFRQAVTHDDEHDLSLTFSASEEFRFYGDPLYKYVAAKRLKMI
jgi:hypothetical protein